MTSEKAVKSTVSTSKIEIDKASKEVARIYEQKRRKALTSILGQPPLQVEPPDE
jgi:hypothetical protein